MSKKVTLLLKPLLIVLLVVCLGANSVSALTWDGAASAGGVGSENSPGAFEVGYLDAAKASGYRFSVVNSSGAVQKGPVDVFRYATNSSHINRAKLTVKYSKSLLKSAYSVASFTTTTSTSGCYYDTSLDLSLPELTTGMEVWCDSYANLNQLFSAAGWGITVDTCDANGWSVLVEPIFAVKLNGENCVFTVTEIAAYGAYIYGENNYVASASSTTSWANISYYTNRDWPNSLRAENGYGLFTAAPALTTYQTSFKTIITSGYGVGILYGENLTKAIKLTLNHNGGSGGTDAVWFKPGINTFYSDAACTNVITSVSVPKKAGYTFSQYYHDGTSGGVNSERYIYADGTFASDLCTDIYQDATLYAKWEANPYTINFDGNGATSGSTASQSATFYQWATLNSNGFKKELPFKYDGNGGTPSVSEETKSAEFIGWMDHNTYRFDGNDIPWYAFDAPFYANIYSDLYNTYGYNKEALFGHLWGYTINGSESRTSSPVFNLKYYMQNGGNDLAEAYGTNAGSYFWHWWYHGYSEGRSGISAIDTSDANAYPDNANVMNLSNVANDTVTLTAKWRDVTVTLPTATRDGYKLVGWNTESDGSGTDYEVGDEVTTGEGLTFYAQWEPVDLEGFTIVYDGNGATEGEGWNEGFNISAEDKYTLSSDNSAFSRVDTDSDTDVPTLFKFVGWKIGDTTYNFGEEISSDVLRENAKTSEDGESSIVTVYAAWDEFPIINAVDRHFSLDDAQEGKITWEELFRKADAVDGEVGSVTDFDNGEGSFAIINFDKDKIADDFKKFTAAGSVTVTYQAVDKAGNETYRTITVYIVDKDKASSDADDEVRYTRFVGAKYYKNSDGSYIAEADGGLNAGSIWINVFEYEKKLTEALSNKKDAATGKWANVHHTWTFTKTQIAEVKAYVEEHGLGNSKESDALANFYSLYEPK